MSITIINRNDITDTLQNQATSLYKQLNSNIKQMPLAQILEGSSDQATIACSKEGDKLVGIALMATYKVISGHKGMIEDVVVDQNYRGKGIGRELMEKLLEEAKNQHLDEVLLFSGHHRLAAIELYKSLGFALKESGLYIKKIDVKLFNISLLTAVA